MPAGRGWFTVGNPAVQVNQRGSKEGRIIDAVKGQLPPASLPGPYPFKPSQDEIAEVLEVPLSVLQDPANLREDARWVDGQLTTSYAYACGEHLVFGATASILEQFLDLLGQVPQQRGG